MRLNPSYTLTLPARRQVLPMPLEDAELADIVREVGGKLVRLELQAVRTRAVQIVPAP